MASAVLLVAGCLLAVGDVGPARTTCMGVLGLAAFPRTGVVRELRDRYNAPDLLFARTRASKPLDPAVPRIDSALRPATATPWVRALGKSAGGSKSLVYATRRGPPKRGSRPPQMAEGAVRAAVIWGGCVAIAVGAKRRDPASALGFSGLRRLEIPVTGVSGACRRLWRLGAGALRCGLFWLRCVRLPGPGFCLSDRVSGCSAAPTDGGRTRCRGGGAQALRRPHHVARVLTRRPERGAGRGPVDLAAYRRTFRLSSWREEARWRRRRVTAVAASRRGKSGAMPKEAVRVADIRPEPGTAPRPLLGRTAREAVEDGVACCARPRDRPGATSTRGTVRPRPARGVAPLREWGWASR